jgi:hypothetical protein
MPLPFSDTTTLSVRVVVGVTGGTEAVIDGSTGMLVSLSNRTGSNLLYHTPPSTTAQAPCVTVPACRMQLHRAPTDNDRTGYADIWRACGIDREMAMLPLSSAGSQGMAHAQDLPEFADAVLGSPAQSPQYESRTDGACVHTTLLPSQSDGAVGVRCEWTMVPRYPVDRARLYLLQAMQAFLHDTDRKEMYVLTDNADEENWLHQLSMEYRLGRSRCKVLTGGVGDSGGSRGSSVRTDHTSGDAGARRAVRIWKAWLYINSTIPSAEALIGGGFGGGDVGVRHDAVTVPLWLVVPSFTDNWALTAVGAPAFPVHVHYKVTYRLSAAGVLSLAVIVDATAVPASLPRVGLQLNFPLSFAQLQWSGRGPHENYPDRKSSAVHAVHSADLRTDTLAVPYVRPGENGARCDVDWLQLRAVGSAAHRSNTAALRISSDRLFSFSAQRHTTEDLTVATHINELTAHPRGFLAVNVDPYLMGVGGDDSWSSCVHKEHELRQHMVTQHGEPGGEDSGAEGTRGRMYSYELSFHIV